MAMAIPPFGLVIGPLLLEFHTNFVSFLLHHLTSAQRSMYSRCFNINVVLHVGIKMNPFKNGSQNVSHWEDPREMMWQQCIYLHRWQTALNANELYSNTNDLKKKRWKAGRKNTKRVENVGSSSKWRTRFWTSGSSHLYITRWGGTRKKKKPLLVKSGSRSDTQATTMTFYSTEAYSSWAVRGNGDRYYNPRCVFLC